MRTKYLLIVSLVSISLIGLELIWTRIFSAEFFYTFAFLILSLAILGLGLGALALRLFSFLNKEKSIGVYLLLAGLGALLGPIAVFQVDLQFAIAFSAFWPFLKLMAVILILAMPYFFAGISLAWIFKTHHEEIKRLYMFDLAAAGGAVILSIVFMNLFGTQAAASVVAVPILLAAAISFEKYIKALPLIIIVACFVFAPQSYKYLKNTKEERAPVIHTHWDAVAKIKIYDYQGYYRGINIDNVANSPVYPFDGNWNKPADSLFQFGINVSHLIKKFDNCTFLSLGAGGGTDILQALQYGAKEAHAVEVIPYINEMMQSGYLKEYTGDVYNDPRVKVATEDARAYVRRFEDKFDVIYSLSSNSWAAMSSGSFALAENYLFTEEAFIDYWKSLTNNGYMMMEHQFYMPRIVSCFMNAMERIGVENPKEHFCVYNLPSMRRMAILISKQPLTDEIRNNALGPITPEMAAHRHLLYPIADPKMDNPINKIVENGWEALRDSAKRNISPVNDDRPFIANMGQLKNFSWDKVQNLQPYDFLAFPTSTLIILAVLAVILIIILPLNLIPFLRKSENMKFSSWLYFFLIGMGFMIIEIILMQKYALYIGSTIYSMATILFVMLVAAGFGSRYSEKFSSRTVFLFIIIWILADAFLFKHLFYILTDLSLGFRIIISATLVAPLGFFLGMPFPLAIKKVKENADWAFAVNGAASTLASTLIILFAMSYGFTLSLLIAAILYSLAYLIYSFRRLS